MIWRYIRLKPIAVLRIWDQHIGSYRGRYSSDALGYRTSASNSGCSEGSSAEL